MPQDRRRTAARRVETGASVVAGTVGSAFGASKLRDAYKEEHPDKFRTATMRVGQKAYQHGMSAPKAERLVRTMRTGKPKFGALVVATTAGVTAAGADRYHDHRVRVDNRAARRKREALAARTPVVKDAFGVRRPDLVAKSQMPDGSYKPISQVSVARHPAVRGSAVYARMESRQAQAAPTVQAQGNRAMGALYEKHGFGMSERGPGALFRDKSTPSAVHPKIHYGASIPAEHHAAMDKRIDPEVAGKLRHPVVIHRDVLPDGVHAAAVGSHVTTGRKGHVVLNANEVSSKGKLHRDMPSRIVGVRGRHILNHEIAHAAVRHTNPVKWAQHDGPEMMRRSMGEEARADARGLKGKGMYQRTGIASTPKDVRRAQNMTPKKMRRHLSEAIGTDREGLRDLGYTKAGLRHASDSARDSGRMLSHYHHVRGAMKAVGAVRKAADTVSAFGVDHGYALGHH